MRKAIPAPHPAGNPREDPREEPALIARCKQGSRAAFDELMGRYERKVYNFAFRLCGNYDDANDIAAESFLRVYNSIEHFRGDSSFITWLFRIVTNIYLDLRKRQRARPQQSLEEALELEETSLRRQFEDPAPGPEEHAQARERTQLLREAVDALPDYQRVMVVMYHMQGKSYEEIAEAVGLPIGTVKSRLNRARLAMRDKLRAHPEHFVTGGSQTGEPA